MRSLAAPLHTLSNARREVGRPQLAKTAAEAFAGAVSPDPESAARSMRLLLERVVVTDTDVELFPRF